MTLSFDRDFDPRHGVPVPVAEGVARITCRNPSPFTFHGTNSYLIGERRLALIDPGPDDDAHLAALLEAIGGRELTHILITHTHRDHSPLAARLKEATGAVTVAEGPHRPARRAAPGAPPVEIGGDSRFRPDVTLPDGAAVEGDGWTLRAVFTPGHAANHTAYALDGTGILFSGDHVMGWSTTVVAPPDGAMADYMTSLDRLLVRDDQLYLPGHGGAIRDPLAHVQGLVEHRRGRERAILERLAAGDETIPAMVAVIYRNVDARLHGAAALSMLAHLEDLAARGLVLVDGPPTLAARYRPA